MKTILNTDVANVEGFMFQGANGVAYFVGCTLLEEDNIEYNQGKKFMSSSSDSDFIYFSLLFNFAFLQLLDIHEKLKYEINEKCCVKTLQTNNKGMMLWKDIFKESKSTLDGLSCGKMVDTQIEWRNVK